METVSFVILMIAAVFATLASFIGPYWLLGWAVAGHRLILIVVAVALTQIVPQVVSRTAYRVLKPWAKRRGVDLDADQRKPRPAARERRARSTRRHVWRVMELLPVPFALLWWHRTAEFVVALVVTIAVLVLLLAVSVAN